MYVDGGKVKRVKKLIFAPFPFFMFGDCRAMLKCLRPNAFALNPLSHQQVNIFSSIVHDAPGIKREFRASKWYAVCGMWYILDKEN